MTFFELARQRYSVRRFKDEPIPEDLLKRILEAGRLAPTAKNNQPQRIYVLKSPQALETIRGLTECTYGAPVVLLFAYDKQEQYVNPYDNWVVSGIEDVSIVATHVMLAAWEAGIGSCWVNRFEPEAVRRAFSLPEQQEVELLMPIGYAADDSVPSPRHNDRKPLEETVKEI